MTDGGTGAGRRIVLATRNPGKLTELTRILAASGIEVTLAGLDEFPGAPEVAETGRTFAENAVLKARSPSCGCHGTTGSPAGVINDRAGSTARWLARSRPSVSCRTCPSVATTETRAWTLTSSQS